MTLSLEISGLTPIPPEILETARRNCPLDELTLGCLREQLLKKSLIKSEWLIVINEKVERELNTIIKETDIIQILPIIAGG